MNKVKGFSHHHSIFVANGVIRGYSISSQAAIAVDTTTLF